MLWSCHQIAEVLQSFIDCELDESAVRRVAAHLGRCRRCGMEADVYREIKRSLSRSARPVSELTRLRLGCVSDELTTGVSEWHHGSGT